MSKQLTISVDDDVKFLIDLPKGRIELRIDKKLVCEFQNGDA